MLVDEFIFLLIHMNIIDMTYDQLSIIGLLLFDLKVVVFKEGVLCVFFP